MHPFVPISAGPRLAYYSAPATIRVLIPICTISIENRSAARCLRPTIFRLHQVDYGSTRVKILLCMKGVLRAI